MRAATIAGVLLIAAARLPAQEGAAASDSARYFTIENCNPLSCLVTLLPPLALQHSVALKAFVRSKTFERLRARYGDRRATDAIFVRSMRLTNNNTGIALVLATAATMDHDVVGLRFPLFKLFVPLTSESTEEFRERLSRLPDKLFDDGPASGDRDKLQHFFGSAALTVLFEADVAAENFGEFVEVGEDAFIEGGKMDARDRRANRRGRAFGAALLDDIHHVPSEFLGRPLIRRASESKVTE